MTTHVFSDTGVMLGRSVSPYLGRRSACLAH